MSPKERLQYCEMDGPRFVRLVMAGALSEADAASILRDREKRAIANVQAQLTARAKAMLKVRDTLIAIDVEDEGGRCYFGTTGQADLLKDVVEDLDAWSWHDIMKDAEGVDYIADNRELRAWKEQALEVEAQWDVQAIGKLLGLKLGEHVRPAIQPAIERLLAALTPFAEAFRKRDDPGVSDLDDEQPMSIHVSLGAWRAANALAPR